MTGSICENSIREERLAGNLEDHLADQVLGEVHVDREIGDDGLHEPGGSVREDDLILAQLPLSEHSP